MNLQYRCIVLDHDDTSVQSTATIHHPAHREVMRTIRPDQEPVDLDTWFLKNFDPGIMGYLSGELGFTEDELRLEYEIWRRHTTATDPPFFPGFLPLVAEYRRRGGIVAVVSHSEEDIIRRHYAANTDVPEFMPDMIFGWTYDESKRKPSPWPVEQIMERHGLSGSEILILDDLKPGMLMAEAAGADFAAAGWGHDISVIRDFMQARSVAYFHTVDEFGKFLLDRP